MAASSGASAHKAPRLCTNKFALRISLPHMLPLLLQQRMITTSKQCCVLRGLKLHPCHPILTSVTCCSLTPPPPLQQTRTAARSSVTIHDSSGTSAQSHMRCCVACMHATGIPPPTLTTTCQPSHMQACAAGATHMYSLYLRCLQQDQNSTCSCSTCSGTTSTCGCCAGAWHRGS